MAPIRWLLVVVVGCSAPEAVTVPLPGACVDPSADSRVAFAEGIDDRPWVVRAWERVRGRGDVVRVENGPDLDGDGTADWLTSVSGFCGSGGCDYRMYVRRGTCGHFVGTASGRAVILAGGRARGLADVTASFHGGCCDWVETRYHFDGARYEPAIARTCEAHGLTVEDRAAIDPSYASWSAVSPAPAPVICSPWVQHQAE